MAESIDEITQTLQKTVPIVILCVGTIGNILSLCVLTRPKTRRFSTAVFLIALTIVDFTAMWSGLIRLIVSGYLKVDIRDISTVMCKMHVFVVYTSTHVSSWLIVGVTVERVVCVWRPVKMHLGRNNKTALIVTMVTVLIFCVINLHLLVGFELMPLSVIKNSNTTVTKCQPALSDTYINFVDKVWPWVDLSLLFLIPLCVLVAGNTLIIIRVRMSRKMRRASCSDTSRQAADSSSLYFLTALLVTLNVVFLVCVAPITIFIIGQYTWWPEVIYTEKELAISRLCWVIVNILVYINYAGNFILYLACGPKVREEFKDMCSCCKLKHTRQTVRESRSTSITGSGSVCHVLTSDILSA